MQHFTPSIFALYLLMSCITFCVNAQMSEFTQTKIKSLQQLVGSYKGTVTVTQRLDVEVTLWFSDKSQPSTASIGGLISFGDDGCVFSLEGGTAYLGEYAVDTMQQLNMDIEHDNEPVLSVMDAQLIGSRKACTDTGLIERRRNASISLTTISGDANRLSLALLNNDSRSFKKTHFNGKASRSGLSKQMKNHMATYMHRPDSRINSIPHKLEIALLNDPSKTLDFQQTLSIFPRNCGQLFAETKKTLAAKDIEAIGSFSVKNIQFLRIKKISEASYIEYQVASSDHDLLTDAEWHDLNISSEHEYVGKKACAIVDAHAVAAAHGLINKYRQKPLPPIEPTWLISKQHDIFIVEATGIDVVRAVNHKTHAQQALRHYGEQEVFTPDDESRTLLWLPKTQKAFTASKYKDYHNGTVHIDSSEQIEAFFEPAHEASKTAGAAVLTLAATFPKDYTVCPRLSGEFGQATCAEYVPSVKSNQIFITHSEQAAIILFKKLSLNATSTALKPHVRAHSETCLTESYCNFPAANFIIPIYENSYPKFNKSNAEYTQPIGERYKDHILLTNTILQGLGFQTAKSSQLNLFPYFAEYYLHMFDQKFSSCPRETQAISIRSDTQAYSIVDGLGNTIEKHDSIALYSDYKIPRSLVSMCNEICGQTGPSRQLSNIANMMAHPSMVRILDGLEQTMGRFTCDSPEILQLEQGILGIYSKLKQTRSQQPFLERSSLL